MATVGLPEASCLKTHGTQLHPQMWLVDKESHNIF